jgi:hypothetical protein
MPANALHRLVDRGSESNAYHPAIPPMPRSGERDDIRLELLGREAPTLGASWLAQARARYLAEWLQSSSVSASFAIGPTFAPAAIPVPMMVLVADQTQPANAGPLRARSAELLRDIGRLTASVEVEPVEDGVTHPGEEIVTEIIAIHGVDLLAYGILKTSPPSVVAAMLRLLGRTTLPDGHVRQRLVEQGLRSTSVEVRDAVVQAIELWEDLESVHLLITHEESVPWLAEYIRRVVAEFRG